MDRTIAIEAFPEISIFQENDSFQLELHPIEEQAGISTFRFSIKTDKPAQPRPVTLRWKLPYVNMAGVWKCGKIHDKRQQYDWELVHQQSRISVDAPVISVFGHDDQNGITFACSDATNLIEMNALLREEDNHLYCHLSFFQERHPAIAEYEAFIRVDTRPVLYSEALQSVSRWWESFPHLKPAAVPELARLPLYSTWYNFHQVLEEDILLHECRLAKDLGYDLIILDDGWQTMDEHRGYDYTGDWQPERFPDLPGFVAKVHALGMKMGLWFSVPFCGKKSQAYQRFKGKFLTENHRWAPVFDPRYPEVRQYLIDTYVQALEHYQLDAFKLDFIDDFRVYPETVLTRENGRDYANVNEAVDRLMTDVMAALKSLKPDIAIEFRQQYIGPAMRKFGNMFRAFDCPNDAVSNRIRTVDVKLLCGDSAVHADPQTWHPQDRVERAALQLLNAFFAVPQLSIHLRKAPEAFLKMIRFYNEYWRAHAHILLDGHFSAIHPLSNYPLLMSQLDEHTIAGVYEDVPVVWEAQSRLDVLNGKMTDFVLLRNTGRAGNFHVEVWSCQGERLLEDRCYLDERIAEIKVPAAGMVRLART
ncbi:MAG: glycoside hydrolase family 36 protein [Bacteroidota bacterium]